MNHKYSEPVKMDIGIVNGGVHTAACLCAMLQPDCMLCYSLNCVKLDIEIVNGGVHTAACLWAMLAVTCYSLNVSWFRRFSVRLKTRALPSGVGSQQLHMLSIRISHLPPQTPAP